MTRSGVWGRSTLWGAAVEALRGRVRGRVSGAVAGTVSEAVSEPGPALPSAGPSAPPGEAPCPPALGALCPVSPQHRRERLRVLSAPPGAAPCPPQHRRERLCVLLPRGLCVPCPLSTAGSGSVSPRPGGSARPTAAAPESARQSPADGRCFPASGRPRNAGNSCSRNAPLLISAFAGSVPLAAALPLSLLPLSPSFLPAGFYHRAGAPCF